MGVTASNYPGGDGGIVSDLVSPSSKEEWISQHAQACQVTEREVRAMWKTFEKLGCDGNGELSRSAIKSIQTSRHRDDATFLQKILEQFPRTVNRGISFQTYCNGIRWFRDASIENRVRGAFKILNNGNPLDEAVLRGILREIYIDSSEAVIRRTSQVFVQEVDAKGQGSIDEEDFVSWVQRMPSSVVEEIMRLETMAVSTTPVPSRSDSDDRPSLVVLRRVAEQAKNRDWLLFVNKLGFTEEEIKDAGHYLGNDKQDEQLFELLKRWRSKTDAVVTVETLRDALVSSGMEAVASSLLDP